MSQSSIAIDTPFELEDAEPWYLRFHDLMPFEVREILVLSSTYDAFIVSEDGRLTERLFAEYSELGQAQAPRITHVASSQKALEMLKERRFDLVITMVRLDDVNVNAFGRMVKTLRPDMPVVLLLFNENDLESFPGGIDRAVIDFPFLWRGDARILLSITKLVEDQRNIDHDIENAGVKCILVVEDGVRRYSAFLTLLYSVIMSQSFSLLSEGLNDLHKTYRMRARPKILLATSYEEAMVCFEKYRGSLMTVISDVNFPIKGIREFDAGFAFAQHVRSEEPQLPILLQSALTRNEKRAQELGFMYLDKNAPNMLRSLRDFLVNYLGFGTFIFKLPDGTEVARANDLYDMEQVLKTVPAESLEYHASRNHLSMWFNARSLFSLADQLRVRTVKDFANTEDIRLYCLARIKAARAHEQAGMITDFSSRQVGPENLFIRMGRGSVGGKGRGLAFMNALFARCQLASCHTDVAVQIPKSICVGTDEFERFMETNRLHESLAGLESDTEIIKRFVAARLSEEHWEDLRFVLKNWHGPLAVRSSSILEDSQYQPFAGIYATYMLANNHPDPQVRFKELRNAIKAVYASLYCRNAKSYIAGTPHSSEEESMAIVIQEVVGQPYGDRFYPLISGVAQSYNYYPVGHQRAEDGLAEIVLGLGHSVVSGGNVFRFCPACPQVLPQFGRTTDYLKYTQKDFFAIDLRQQTIDFAKSAEKTGLCKCTLADAEGDGTLMQVGSVYCPEDNQLRESFKMVGPRVVSFNNIVKWNDIPLPAVLREVIEAIRREAGFAIEIEFALDRKPGQKPVLYILQMRPLAIQIMHGTVETEGFDLKDILCHTDMALGHGSIKTICDIVYVKPDKVTAAVTPHIGEYVGQLNAALVAQKRGYFLVGPGRWGSSDPSLGIPLEWTQISGARVIAETSFLNQHVEPSQGTHFFQNLIAKGVGYLTLSRPSRESKISESFLDTAWLEAQPVMTETEWVRHIRLAQPITVNLDGRVGKASVIKPAET